MANKAASRLIDLKNSGKTEHYPSAIRKFFASTCLYPKKLSVMDRFVSQGKSNMTEMYFACGKCYQCRNTRGNMLATRLYLDAVTLKHCYFITLHFKGYDKPEDIPYSLLGMVWHYDNLNKTKHLQYHPCFIDYSVFQKFFAHLRMNMRRDNNNVTPVIKYFIGCEYGSLYGRPHAHIILISDTAISRKDIARVWKFGSFDFEDLVQNGTMENIGSLSSKRCFKYVAKYANKKDDKFCKTRYSLGEKFLLSLIPGSDILVNFEEYIYVSNKYQSNLFNNYYVREQFKSREDVADAPSSQAERIDAYNLKKFGWQALDKYYPVRVSSPYYPSVAFYSPASIAFVFGQKGRISSGNPIGKSYFDANFQDVLRGGRRLPRTINAHSTASFDRKNHPDGQKGLDNAGWQLSWPSQFDTWLNRFKEPLCLRQKMPNGSYQDKKIFSLFVDIMYKLQDSAELSFFDCEAFRNYCQDYKFSTGDSFVSLSALLPYLRAHFSYALSFCVSGRDKFVNHFEESFVYNKETHMAYKPFVELDSLGNPCQIIWNLYSYNRRTRDYDYCESIDNYSFLDLLSSGFETLKDEHVSRLGDRSIMLDAYNLCFDESQRFATESAISDINSSWADFRSNKLMRQKYIESQNESS